MDPEPPYVYPAKPDEGPSGPEVDGMADVVVTEEYVELHLMGGAVVRIPGCTILRDSLRITAGGDSDVNRLELTLITGSVSFGPNVSWTERVEPVRKIAVDGKAELPLAWFRA